MEKPHARAGKAPSKVCPKCQTRMHSCKKKCPTCGECFGTAKAGGAHAERWKHIQSHASGNTEADVTILKVEDLRERLESRGLSSEGLKKELQARLLAEYRKPPGDPAADAAAAAAAADALKAAPAPSAARKPAAAPRKKPAPAPVSGRKKQTIAPRKAPKKKNDGAACAPRRAAKPLVGGEDARSLIERAAPISVRQDNPKKGASALRYAKYMARKAERLEAEAAEAPPSPSTPPGLHAFRAAKAGEMRGKAAAANGKEGKDAKAADAPASPASRPGSPEPVELPTGQTSTTSSAGSGRNGLW